MGGWCTRRGECARYHQAQRRSPSERLCIPGQSDVFAPIVVRPAGEPRAAVVPSQVLQER
jgi:hypothetical protein